MSDLAWIVAIGVLAFLFAGEPDVHDVIRNYIDSRAKAEACK
jgi:hypothetical protein